ncbi:MAG: twin-arginine translocase subunit TatC [Fimbriimonadaceae bacterium]
MARRLDQEDGSSSEQSDELRLTLGEHLEELRVRIFRIAAVIAVGMVAGWFLVVPVYDHFIKMVKSSLPKDFEFTTAWSSLSEPFMFQLKLALVLGLVVTIPITVMQLWGFIKPGLKPHERKPLQRVVPISLVLFAFGCLLGYTILPVTYQWFAGMSSQFKGSIIIQSPSEIVLFSAKMMLAFGIGFQLPIIVFFLTKLGIITPEAITRYWRQAAVGVFTAAAIITPSGDLFSMTLMGLPMVILTFASIGAARLTMKDRDGSGDVLNSLD